MRFLKRIGWNERNINGSWLDCQMGSAVNSTWVGVQALVEGRKLLEGDSGLGEKWRTS